MSVRLLWFPQVQPAARTCWSRNFVAPVFCTLRSLGVKSQDVVPSIQLEEADGCDAVSSCQEDRVDTHQNAPMTPAGRLRLVEAVLEGETIRSVAERHRTDRK